MPGGALPPGVRVYRRKRLYTADSDASGAGDGGGIRRASGTVTVKNTLMAGNTDASSGTKHPDCSGMFTTQGYNLIGINTGCSGFTHGVNGNQVGTSGSPLNPQLGPLADNGGSTLTHALLTASPAIDKGNPATPGSGGNACAATDQRGYVRPVDGDNNGSALCDTGGYELGAVPSTPITTATTITITYGYDQLYRLTSANYTDGKVFIYTYDAVGNRLTQTTLTNTTVYTYDIANRLTNVGPLAYIWDNNGNLLNDGVYTYTYDAADRLITTTQGANTYTFKYNGLGDRLRQTANGAVTTYTLDLNAGLTQVLADGTNTYLYGNGRVAQQSVTSTDYFLGDALGSVRQLANAGGAVTLARSYDPYGNVLSSAGNGTTIYNFTGEIRDATNLIYLRARYLSTSQGRFLTADTFPGDDTRPQSLNRWAYAEGDPVNRTDPSGHTVCLYGVDPITGACKPDPFGNLLPPAFGYAVSTPKIGPAGIIVGTICAVAIVAQIIRTAISQPEPVTWIDVNPQPNPKPTVVIAPLPQPTATQEPWHVALGKSRVNGQPADINFTFQLRQHLRTDKVSFSYAIAVACFAGRRWVPPTSKPGSVRHRVRVQR